MSKHKLITQLEDLIDRHRAGLGATDTATLTEAVAELKRYRVLFIDHVYQMATLERTTNMHADDNNEDCALQSAYANRLEY